MTVATTPHAPASKYPHLGPDYVEVADRNDEERLAFISRDRYLSFHQTDAIMKAMNRLYRQETSIRAKGMLLVGESLIGKSFLIDQFKKEHPADDNIDGDSAIVPVVHITVAGRARADLYREIMGSLNARPAATAKPDAVRVDCIELMKSVDMRVLIIEEFQDLLVGTTTEQDVALNHVKYIMSQTGRPIIAAGVEMAANAVNRSTQIKSRLREKRLRRFELNKEYLEALVMWEKTLPLRRASNLDDIVIAQDIHARSDGVTGRISELLQVSAELSIEDKSECITTDTLARADEEIGSIAAGSD
ncbi:TniB family NTP-binding protein [Variovorax paradoxus]|uniref:TniB family NTP-binding protein n=1 Tax=Variovorax paradoxus TaxID=34073 RepID=UPI0029C82AFC|nr:TniB family NTP-binding protein [Variovorax paradoxus]WPH20802.1 TniB family NTP-binding protein [Variovorax paradoxus]